MTSNNLRKPACSSNRQTKRFSMYIKTQSGDMNVGWECIRQPITTNYLYEAFGKIVIVLIISALCI